jgi:vancomycin resistance protein YoaR
MLLGLGALVVLFVVANVALWAIYRERTYPRARVMGVNIGSVKYGSLPQKLSEMKLLPTSVRLEHQDRMSDVSFGDLGIQKDAGRAAKSASSQRSWLPILNLVRSPELKAPIRIEENTFNAKAAELAGVLRKDAVDAQLSLDGSIVTIKPAANGFELAQKSLRQAVILTLDRGKNKVDVPVETTKPKLTADSLKPAQATLEGQLKTSVVYRFNGKSRQARADEIAAWFVRSGEAYVLDKGAVQGFITQVGKDFGIRIKNAATVASSTQQAIEKQKSLDLTVEEQQTAAKTFMYCVAAKGVDASHLSDLKSMLQATYGDNRGWSLDGQVAFQEVGSGCNFTVWLSAANLMPTFGGVCDSTWSCRSGPNVVINFDRWQGASPAWNANGGSLSDYRHMVINHETGHWLGFGHAYCSGAGQPAPVMQQQSIDLQGCKFSPWPSAGELASLRRTLGL